MGNRCKSKWYIHSSYLKSKGNVAKSSWTPDVDGTGSVVGTGRAKSVLARSSASSEVAVHGY